MNKTQRHIDTKSIRNEIPYVIQFGNSIAGIASLVLGVFMGFQSLEIKGMKEVLSVQNAQFDKLTAITDFQHRQLEILSSQVNELKSINSVAALSSNKLSSQLSAINGQTRYTIVSSKPDINYTHTFLDSLGFNEYLYRIIIKNFGDRPALRLQEKFYFFRKQNKSFQKIWETADTANRFPQSDLKAGQEIATSQNFTTTPRGYWELKNAYVVLQIKYMDPLTSRYIYPMPFFIQNSSRFGGLRSIEALEEDKILLQKLIPKYF